MLFAGEYHHQIDEKGRIRVPSKFKDMLGESPMILRGTGGCLFVYEQSHANEVFTSKFSSSDFTNPEKTKAMRLITASAIFADEDKQGRILLPANLIKHAGIEKNIVTIGAFDHIEIWSEERWNNYADLDNINYDECLKALS